MEAPSTCTQHVEQFIVPLNLAYTCYRSPCQMIFWLNCSQSILHPNFRLISHLQTCSLNMLQTSKLFGVV
jgi:hypothetical protein